MSLAAKLAAAQPEPKPLFEQRLEELSEADMAALIEAANNRAWSNIAIVRVLRDEGIAVGKDTFSAWRSRVTG